MNYTHSKEMLQHLSEVKKGIYYPTSSTYIFTSPNGARYKENNLRAFCREHNLHQPTMAAMATGSAKKKSKGWSVERLTRNYVG